MVISLTQGREGGEIDAGGGGGRGGSYFRGGVSHLGEDVSYFSGAGNPDVKHAFMPMIFYFQSKFYMFETNTNMSRYVLFLVCTAVTTIN